MSQDALLSIVHGTESTCIPVDKWMSATKGTGLSEAEAVPKSENAGPITWRLRIKADDIKWSVLSGIILFLKTDQPFPIGKQADVESVLRLAQRFQMQAVTDACERGMLDPRGQKIVKLGQAFAFAYNFKLNRLREECERTAVYAKDMQDCSLFDAHHPSARKDNAASASAAAGSTADDGCCSSLGWCIFIALLALAAGFGVREYVRRQHVLMERDVAGRIEDALEHQVVKVKEQAMQEAVLKTVQDIEFLSCPPHLFVVEMLYQSGHVVDGLGVSCSNSERSITYKVYRGGEGGTRTSDKSPTGFIGLVVQRQSEPKHVTYPHALRAVSAIRKGAATPAETSCSLPLTCPSGAVITGLKLVYDRNKLVTNVAPVCG